jgi:hypothetical protein
VKNPDEAEPWPPLTRDELHQYAEEGRIAPTDLIWHPTVQVWTPADLMPELKLPERQMQVVDEEDETIAMREEDTSPSHE